MKCEINNSAFKNLNDKVGCARIDEQCFAFIQGIL